MCGEAVKLSLVGKDKTGRPYVSTRGRMVEDEIVRTWQTGRWGSVIDTGTG